MVIWLGQQNSENAGVAELADALALGASALACRFKSCHPHQSPEGVSLRGLLLSYSLFTLH